VDLLIKNSGFRNDKIGTFCLPKTTCMTLIDG